MICFITLFFVSNVTMICYMICFITLFFVSNVTMICYMICFITLFFVSNVTMICYMICFITLFFVSKVTMICYMICFITLFFVSKVTINSKWAQQYKKNRIPLLCPTPSCPVPIKIYERHVVFNIITVSKDVVDKKILYRPLYCLQPQGDQVYRMQSRICTMQLTQTL